LLGGALTEYATWRWCFYINLPAGGLVAFFLFFIHIPSHTAQITVKSTLNTTLKSLDLTGFTLFAPTAIMFLLALEWGGSTYRWDSAVVLGLFCGSAGLLVVFLAWEYRSGDEAMIPLPMVRRKVIASSCLAMAFAAANMLTTSYYMAIYFQADRGVLPMLSGVYLLPTILSQMVFGILSGVLGKNLSIQIRPMLTSFSRSAGLLPPLHHRRHNNRIHRQRLAKHT
jgi:MFS family permease